MEFLSNLDCRADSRFAPSQWETPLQNKDVSHWLGAILESALDFDGKIISEMGFWLWGDLWIAWLYMVWSNLHLHYIEQIEQHFLFTQMKR